MTMHESMESSMHRLRDAGGQPNRLMPLAPNSQQIHKNKIYVLPSYVNSTVFTCIWVKSSLT